MNLATLRVSGTDLAIEAVCKLLQLSIDQEWKKGDPKRREGFFLSSGLNATIVDAKNPGEMLVAIREFVAKCKAQNVVFSGSDLSAELAIGVTVGDTEQFVACVDFSTHDLLSLGALGLELSVAAYPTSDEANESDQNA